MAGRSTGGASHNNDVNERRLRPIYDCMDSGNHKKAIQEADRLLKKQKDLHCAKALKALALIRLSKVDEAQPLLQEIHSLSPSDDSTLGAMAMCYRDLGRNDLIADMYENANKVRKDSEDILNALFMAYVKLSNFKKQQQVGMLLHKLRPQKNPYYFWSVMSILMQGEEDEKLGRVMYLPLAEKMTLKYIQEDKLEAEAEVRLYLMILESAGKFSEIIEVLRGPLKGKLTTDLDFSSRYEAETLVRLERWGEAAQAYEKLILQSADNWIFYKEYLRCALQVIENPQTGKTEKSENSAGSVSDLSDIVKFLSAQVSPSDSTEKSYPLRAPYLAQLELIKLLKERGNPVWNTIIGSPVELLSNYCEKFSGKACCFSDIADYIHLVDNDQLNKWIDDLSAKHCTRTEDGSILFPSTVVDIQKHVLVVQLSQFSGRHESLSKDQLLALIDELTWRYKDGLKFGADISKTGIQFVDWNVQMAAHLLYSLHAKDETHGWEYLIQAIMLLEDALSYSPSNFHLKLLLMRLYADIGAAAASLKLFESMDIKHIQYDSLGWTVFIPLLRFGHLTSVHTLLGHMIQFFFIGTKEICDYLVSAYKFGSFPKIKEIISFRQRLQHSVQYSSATVEQIALELFYHPASHGAAVEYVKISDIDTVERQKIEELRDNRDLDVQLCWDPHYQQTKTNFIQKSFNEMVMNFKLSSLTVRSVTVAVHLSESVGSVAGSAGAGAGSVAGGDRNGTEPEKKESSDSVGNDESTVLRGMMTELSDLIQRLDAEHGAVKQSTSHFVTDDRTLPLTAPSRTRLSSFTSLGLGTHLLKSLELLLHFYSVVNNKSSDNKITVDVSKLPSAEDFKSLCDLVTSYHKPVVSCNTLNNGSKFHPEVLEATSLFVWLSSVLTVVCGCCFAMLKPVKQAINRKGKKKVQVDETKTSALDQYSVFYEGLTSFTQQLNTTLQQLVPDKDLTDKLKHLSLKTGVNGDKGEEVKDNNSAEPKPDAVSNGTTHDVEVKYESASAVWSDVRSKWESKVWSKLEQSFVESKTDLSQVISKKIKYLGELKL